MITIPGYGWIRQLPDYRDHEPWKFTSQPLPPHFSLEDKMPPIWNQGRIGSCSAHGSCAAFVTDRMRQGEPAMMPSRLFAYYNGRALMGTTLVDSGCSVRDVIKGLAQWGAPPDELWGYEADHVTTKPPDAAYAEARKHQVSLYAPVLQSVDAIKLAILNGFPVVFGFSVYQSFEHGAVQRTGIMSMPGWFDVSIAGHCVAAMGWNSNGYFQIRNSWGTEWGDRGYFWMPEGYIICPHLSSDFWIVKSVTA